MPGSKAPRRPAPPLFTRETVELEIHPSFRPGWLGRKRPVRLPVVSLLPCERDGEILLSCLWKGERRPAMVREGASTHVFFAVRETIRAVLREQGVRFRQPLISHVPFHYHRLPASVRSRLGSLLTTGRPGTTSSGFPAFPMEQGLHALLHVLDRCGPGWQDPAAARPAWPGDKRYCVVLTHDVDTGDGCRLAPNVLAREAALGFRSSWNVVGSLFERNRGHVNALFREGGEIGLHGADHRLKTPFQAPEEIRKRLGEFKPLVTQYAIHGYRSPCYLRSEALFSALEGEFHYDSSVPDTDVFTPGRDRGGCCLAYPYPVGDLVELPVTVPFEIPLHMGTRARDLNGFWEEKVAWIREAGGMILVNTHPEPQYLGNPRVLQAYETLLRQLSGDPDAWYALPGEVAAFRRRTPGKGAGERG